MSQDSIVGEVTGSCTAKGTGFSSPLFNSLMQPLGIISLKTDKVNGLTFKFTGDNLTAIGSSVLLYEDRKVEMLKKNSANIQMKGFMTLLPNALIKDKNPVNDDTRSGEIDYERDIAK